MTFFAIVGGAVCAIILIGLVLVGFTIIGNVYGGLLGAYRLRRILMDHGRPAFSHGKALRLALDCWAGKRYRNGLGHFWDINGMVIPIDGRDKIDGSDDVDR